MFKNDLKRDCQLHRLCCLSKSPCSLSLSLSLRSWPTAHSLHWSDSHIAFFATQPAWSCRCCVLPHKTSKIVLIHVQYTLNKPVKSTYIEYKTHPYYRIWGDANVLCVHSTFFLRGGSLLCVICVTFLCVCVYLWMRFFPLLFLPES